MDIFINEVENKIKSRCLLNVKFKKFVSFINCVYTTNRNRVSWHLSFYNVMSDLFKKRVIYCAIKEMCLAVSAYIVWMGHNHCYKSYGEMRSEIFWICLEISPPWFHHHHLRVIFNKFGLTLITINNFVICFKI